MKHSLVVINRFARFNSPYVDYLQRACLAKMKRIDSLILLEENDKELFLELERISAQGGNIVIATTKSHMATVAKLLATMLDDTLIYKDDFLLPSKATLYTENSFLVEHEGSQINLIQADESRPLPEILIKEESKEAILHLFKIDHDSAQLLLSPLAESHNVHLSSRGFIEGWSLMIAQSQRYGDLSTFIASAKALMPGKIISSQNIIAFIIEKLYENNRTIMLAESCSGGLLSYLFAKEGGASHILHGGIVSYANEAKQRWLRVNEDNLELYGAVSESVVRDMLEGGLQISNADYALAISGIAGPGGGSDAKPVGTVFVGGKSRRGDEIIERIQFTGDRNYVQTQAAWHAVLQLIYLAERDLF